MKIVIMPEDETIAIVIAEKYKRPLTITVYNPESLTDEELVKDECYTPLELFTAVLNNKYFNGFVYTDSRHYMETIEKLTIEDLNNATVSNIDITSLYQKYQSAAKTNHHEQQYRLFNSRTDTIKPSYKGVFISNGIKCAFNYWYNNSGYYNLDISFETSYIDNPDKYLNCVSFTDIMNQGDDLTIIDVLNNGNIPLKDIFKCIYGGHYHEKALVELHNDIQKIMTGRTVPTATRYKTKIPMFNHHKLNKPFEDNYGIHHYPSKDGVDTVTELIGKFTNVETNKVETYSIKDTDLRLGYWLDFTEYSQGVMVLPNGTEIGVKHKFSVERDSEIVLVLPTEELRNTIELREHDIYNATYVSCPYVNLLGKAHPLGFVKSYIERDLVDHIGNHESKITITYEHAPLPFWYKEKFHLESINI